MEDTLIYVIDVLFARELNDNFSLWWFDEFKD